MRWLSTLAVVGAAVALVSILAGSRAFERPAPLQLLRVVDLSPRDVEVGDRIALAGDGFPPGRVARVTFRGALYRPGERPQPGAEIVLEGAVASPERVEVPFDDAAEGLFCGAGDRALHATFEGDVEVAFAAAAAGQPPVAGVLEGVTLDVRPASSAGQSTREAEGTRVLAALGLRVSPVAHDAGLLVDEVAPRSRAAEAGVMAGDVLTRVGHLRVASAGDVLLAAGSAEVALGLRRGGVGEIARTVRVAGLRRAAPEELLVPALCALAALAFVLFFAVPAPARLEAALHGVVASLRREGGHEGDRQGGGRRAPDPWRAWRASWTAAARDVLPPSGLPALADAAACGALAVLPFGQYLVAARLDVGVLFVAAAAGLSAAALVGLAGSRSPSAGARAALHVAWQHAPAAIALAGVVVVAGSLRAQEIARAQGGWPWEWLAFRSPASLVSFAIFLGTARVEAPSGSPWVDAASRAHRLVVAGLAAALFLGGWSLPWLSSAQEEARPALQVAGALLFAVKVGCLVVVLAWLRRAAASRDLARGSRAGVGIVLWRLPLAVAAAAAAAAWTTSAPAFSAQLLASAALVMVAAIAGIVASYRVLRALAAPERESPLSSFL